MVKSAVAFAPAVMVTFCGSPPLKPLFSTRDFVVSGEQVNRLIFPADGVDHVDDVLVEIVGVNFGGLEFLGAFTVPESEPIPEIMFAPATALLSARI